MPWPIVDARLISLDWVNGGNPPSDSLNAAANTGVNAVSTGLYALLGAELCRITKDTSYCDRTLTSLVWLDNHLVSPSGLIWDGITGDACKVTEWTFTCESSSAHFTQMDDRFDKTLYGTTLTHSQITPAYT